MKLKGHSKYVPAHFKRTDEVKDWGHNRSDGVCVVPGCPFPPLCDSSGYCEACRSMREEQVSTLARRDRRRVRELLGLRRGDVLPRCPGKSNREVRRLETDEGDLGHGAVAHVCVKCACRNTAGYGTDHLGWGYCFQHEKTHGEERSRSMATAHRNTLISRNPGVYSELNRYAESIHQGREEGSQKLGVMEDLRLLRGVIQEIISRSESEDHQLTEYVDGVRQPMSDKTRLGLLANLLPKVNTFLATEHRLRQHEMIEESQFKVWFGQFFSCLESLCNELDTGGIENGTQLKERFRDMMRDLGDPRTMERGE